MRARTYVVRVAALHPYKGASDLRFRFASKLEASKRLGLGRGASYLEVSVGLRPAGSHLHLCHQGEDIPEIAGLEA